MTNNRATKLLLETGLRHLFDGETQAYDSLTLLIEKASNLEVKNAFQMHQTQTLNQIDRLRKVFDLLGLDPNATTIESHEGIGSKGKELFKQLLDMNFTEKSKGMAGIISEGKELLRHFGDTEVADLALCGIGQKIEHFEIACYAHLKMIANRLDQVEIANLLQQNLLEEEQMNSILKKIASHSLVESSA